jgi:thiosulfate/3-mercaptopyruvate sulfurtransferase
MARCSSKQAARFALLLLLSLPALTLAAPPGWKPLLEPGELAGLLQQGPVIRLIRVTGNYGRGHIPGSVESPYPDWRGTGRNPGQLRSLGEYTALLQALGIAAATPVVVIHQGSDPADMGAATRVYWTLKSLGVADVAVLNGGYQAWRQADLPVSNETATVFPSDYQPVWLEDWRVTTDQVEQLVRSGNGTLIDARPVSFYRGLRATLGKPGTIQGAGNIAFESWFDGDRLPSVESLQQVLGAYGEVNGPVTVSFCNTGHWASINWFVMSELLQVDNTRLYAESVAEWSEQERPMDNQVGRLRVYRDLTSRWFNDLIGN